MDPILTLSALELAQRIRAGSLSAGEVVSAHVERLRAVNPTINAVVEDRYQAALADARAADARRRAAASSPATLPPLLGVPFTVKEMVSLAGMPHTFGSRAREGRRAPVDAVVVKRLRDAGAIPLGVTNVPEWGFWFETDNLLYGRTNNPYDASRISGGSSGGEAAAIGAGGSPFGVGSDIGGSIRMPAAFCGVFGHKPTHGLLPLTGHYPVYASGPDAQLAASIPWLTLGPLARRATDLMPLLRIMAGPDGVDPNAEPLALGDPRGVEWRGRRVLVLEEPRILGAGRVSADVRQAVAAAARALEQRGAILEPLPRNYFRRGLRIWFGALRSTAGAGIAPLLAGGAGFHLPGELARLLLRRGRYTFPALMFALMDSIGYMTEERSRNLAREGASLARDLERHLGPDGLLLLPAHPRVAPPHYAPYFRPFDFGMTAVLNVTRMPATAVPVGLDPHGLPLAVQVAAARGRDHLTIAAAVALEEAFGGWTPPPPEKRAKAKAKDGR